LQYQCSIRAIAITSTLPARYARRSIVHEASAIHTRLRQE
jgi:hypothetical protein